MLYGIYQSAGGLQVNQYRQEVLANNLANIATVGFKPDLAVARERQTAQREDGADPALTDPIAEGLTGGSLVAPTYTLFKAGPIEPTGNPLDVAISGEGFFAVQDGKEERYTRSGRFMIDADGTLVTVAGHHPVLTAEGGHVVVPKSAGKVRIDAGGQVRAGQLSLGQLKVVDFQDKMNLKKTGKNLMQSLGGRPVELEPTLLTGAVEASAVDPTATMVAMIEASRAYQLNATLVGLADSTLGRAVNDIARLR